MKSMILKHPDILTHIEIWAPKWSGKYEGEGERILLPAKYKVDSGSPVIIMPITKYEKMKGLRLCMPRSEIQKYPTQFNGGEKGKGIECYRVPFSDLYTYDTVSEVKEKVRELWPETSKAE